MLIQGQQNLADLFGIARKTVDEWQQRGMPVATHGGPNVGNEYDSAACIAWLVEREVRKVQGESPKDRLARLQGDDYELRLAEKRGELIRAADVEPAMRAAIVSARERVRGEPPRLARAMEGLALTEREALLRDLLDEVLTGLSKWQQAEALAD
jgi:phage terminase Nu1 subunit (DNA packaging protein)